MFFLLFCIDKGHIYGIKDETKKKGGVTMFALVKNSINSNVYNTELFYILDLEEAIEYTKKGVETTNDGEGNKMDPFVIMWEVYEMPCNFDKPKIKNFMADSIGSNYQSPVPKMAQYIREHALKKIK